MWVVAMVDLLVFRRTLAVILHHGIHAPKMPGGAAPGKRARFACNWPKAGWPNPCPKTMSHGLVSAARKLDTRSPLARTTLRAPRSLSAFPAPRKAFAARNKAQ